MLVKRMYKNLGFRLYMKMSLKIRRGIVIVIFLNMAFVSCARSNKFSFSAIDSFKEPLMVDVNFSQLNQKIEDFITDTSEKFARFADFETRLQDLVKIPGKWLQDVIANSDIEICSCPPGKHGSPEIKGQMDEKVRKEEANSFKWLLLFIQNLEVKNIQIFIASTSKEDRNCNVTYPNLKHQDTIKITSNSTSTYSVDKSMTLATGYSRKGIVVECDVPVSVFGFNHVEDSSDGFAVLPVSMIGQEYIVPAYMPNPQQFSLFGMTTLTNKTRITILTTSKGGKVKFDNRFYDEHSSFTLTLDALQTAQVECQNCDLSGTSISSSAPIAIVAGASCANILSESCSHISEMVFPTSAYSDLFIIPNLPKWYTGKVRIFTNKRASVSTLFLNSKTQKISSNEFAELSYNEVHSIAATSPVMVQLYGNTISGKAYGRTITDNADAFMITIPGINHYKNRYTFTVPDFNFNSSLSFIIPSENKDGIRLDGKPVIITGEREVVLHNISYTSFSVPVTPGFHMSEHVNKDCFGLFIVGFQYADGYGFIAGI